MTFIPRDMFKKGIDESIKNAEHLIEAAKTLFNKGEYHISVFLALQGIEEYGKSLLLIEEIKRECNKISDGRWKKVYKNHLRN